MCIRDRYIASQRELTSLENVLLQCFILFSGLSGSFIFGKRAAESSAQELMKPHAKSAFRRLLSLYYSLSRVANEIEASKDPETKISDKALINKLESIVVEQIATADDALHDWNDLVPDEVEELKSNLKSFEGRRLSHD